MKNNGGGSITFVNSNHWGMFDEIDPKDFNVNVAVVPSVYKYIENI